MDHAFHGENPSLQTGLIPAVSLTLQPAWTAGLGLQRHQLLELIDPFFGQIVAFVLLRQAMARGKYLHLMLKQQLIGKHAPWVDESAVR